MYTHNICTYNTDIKKQFNNINTSLIHLLKYKYCGAASIHRFSTALYVYKNVNVYICMYVYKYVCICEYQPLL